VMGVVSALMLGVFTLWPVSHEAAGFIVRGWVPPSPLFLWLTLAQALGAIAAVSLITQAYRIGDPSFTAVYEYSFLVFAGLWSYSLWGQTTNLLACLGIGVILLSGTAAAWISQRHLPALEFHPVRRELSPRRPPKAQNG
jgi:drug/metabolite transporter (DMT)-like permease